ncbi:MAG: AbrB/MazE/SpoVT family DNA-binding domain-containing protein [Gammaproteobacteria bacterium]|nr:AbrB/MazE/SpoVT family DNA-binding domain-containing protein [Gammaproteobacteria bacterium]
MKTKAQKWGNSLAVRVPRGIVETAGLQPEDALEVEVVKGKIVLTPAAKGSRPKYRLNDLVKRITAKNRYAEEDFGAPAGREVW